MMSLLLLKTPESILVTFKDNVTFLVEVLKSEASCFCVQAVEVIVGHGGAPDPKLQSQKTQAFLSLARFSDAQYQGIENYMRSSEFENKQALLEKAKEEVDLMKERKVTNNRSAPENREGTSIDVCSSVGTNQLNYFEAFRSF